MPTRTIQVASKVRICVSPVNAGLVVQNMSQIGNCSLCKKKPNFGGILLAFLKYLQSATCMEIPRLAMSKRTILWAIAFSQPNCKNSFFIERGANL